MSSLLLPLRRAGHGPAALACLAVLTATVLDAGQIDTFSNGKPASSVLGQASLGVTAGNNRGGVPAANTLWAPASVAVDPVTGKVFVADTGNNRVLRYASTAALANGAAAEAVLGQPNLATTAAAISRSRMSDPVSVCCDLDGRLWVLDGNRVLRFDNAANAGTGANADGVLGQPDFTSSTAGDAANRLGTAPSSIFVGVTGSLWVASADLNRISRFGNAASKANGANADAVLGQPDFATFTAATTRSGLTGPGGIAVDLAGNLFVADTGNHRVLIFADADTLANGSPADIVLGQLLDTDSTVGSGPFGMNTPASVAVNDLGTLFVSDQGNDRVLLFLNAAAKGDGGTADGVLGQADLDTQGMAALDRGFLTVQGLWADGNRRLWAADPGRARVLRFDSDRFQPDALIGGTPAKLTGNNLYNRSGADQSHTLETEGPKIGRAHVRLQNDGDVPDGQKISASGGNRLVQVNYFKTPGGNVTASAVAGRLSLPGVAAGAATSLQIRAGGTKDSRDRRIKLKTRLLVESTTDGSADRVNCEVIKGR
jgi:DNA-binding beta-propeller fold protein YncE